MSFRCHDLLCTRVAVMCADLYCTTYSHLFKDSASVQLVSILPHALLQVLARTAIGRGGECGMVPNSCMERMVAHLLHSPSVGGHKNIFN